MKTIAKKYRSMKGKMNGQAGAPEKAVRYPRGNFTVNSAIKLNAGHVCGLTVRNRITDDLKAKKLVRAPEDRKQPGGAVGRPQRVYILAELLKAKATKTAPKTSTPTAAVTPRKPRTVKANTVILAPVVAITPTVSVPVEVPAPVTIATSPEGINVEVAETVNVGTKVIAPVVPAPLP